VSTIYDLTGRLNLERSFAEDLVKRGVSVDESRRLILDQVAAKSDETRTFPHVSIPLGGRDERVTRREAVANALLHRYSPTLFPLEDAARQYRGMTLLELARESLGNAGVNTRGLSRDEVATRALHSTSDFPEILSAVTNKTLRQAYDAYPRTFALFCRQVLATDFKSMHRVQLGEAPQLLEVGESGEFKRGIVGAHDTGPLIRSKNGFWLAIPLPAAGSHGRPRMTEEPEDAGVDARHRHVGRLMRENGIIVERPEKFKATTDSGHTFTNAPNLPDHDFAADCPKRNGQATSAMCGPASAGCSGQSSPIGSRGA
jgi:hypothetical protein